MKCPPGHARVRIRYFAVPNANTRVGGFCPVFRINRQRTLYDRTKLRVRGDTFCKGYDKSDALHRARAMAQEDAARYVGDQCVTVESSARGERGFAGARRKRRR